jgi:hypothetical protein
MRRTTQENLKIGLAMGLLIATLYSAWAVGLFLISGREAFEKYNVSVIAVLATYYAAGIIGGALVGLALPMARSFFGRIVVGVVAALVFFFCVFVAMQGPFWHWTSDVWGSVASLGLIFGVVCSVLWRRFTGL